jgi:hypothetical protein
MQDAARHVEMIHDLIFLVGCLVFLCVAKVIPFRSWSLKLTAMLSTIAVIAAAFWLTTRATPPLSDVNGNYRNACCETISLREGVLVTPRQQVPFNLELLKFGLVANLSAPIEVVDGRVVVSPNASTTSLGFSEDLKSFTICGPGHCGPGREFQFVRR